MCSKNDQVIFHGCFRGHAYRVVVVSVEDRVDIFLPVHETFENLVSCYAPELGAAEIQTVAGNEYQTCLRDGIRLMRGFDE